MDLYNEEIDEFVDWVSGEDVISKRDRTGFKLVSGGKIRELLQNHLREPIIFIEDSEEGLYRVFSSEKAYRRWLADPVENSKLQLFTFARPSAYKITTGLLSETRYMAKTNSSQEESKLKYTWSIGNEEDPNYVDTLRVTYKIEKGDGNSVSYVLVYNNNNKSVEEDIYQYLTSGINTVTVSMRGSSSGASAGFTITIIVLDLLVSSNFDFSRPLQNGELLFSRNLEYIFISRNDTSIDTSIYIYVDGQLCTKKDLKEKDNQIWIEVRNTWQAGYHDLLIYAESKYNNSTFLSNVLYYRFINSSEPKLDYFITLGTSLYGGIPPYASLQLSATLFELFSLDWGYYTNAVQTNTSIPITWKLLNGSDVITLTTHSAQKGLLAESLKFIPSIYSEDIQIYLAAYYENSQIVKIPINITKGSSSIIETPSYDLKLDAYGKTNSSSINDLWEFLNANGEIITTSFNGISWDESSGWYENSLRVKGQSQQAIVNYNPFKGTPEDGRTIEIEFESENVENASDVIIRIGSEEGSRIEITPNSASLFDSDGIKRIYTNFKANERVKLAFIINGEARSPIGQILPENKLAYIVNNGILERGADINGILFGSSLGSIIIGGSNSGVRVYSLRVYLRAITYLDEYDNFVFDSSDKTSIINRNAILKGGNIDYDLCYNKLDTILIKGNISNLLNKSSTKEKSESNVTITRHNPFDVTGASDFTVEEARIRKHGQSTLNYPVPSMKFWLNQKWHSDEKPTLEWEGGKTLNLAKNRYIMKSGAIPANKFVLQANYADSSGVHNGSIQRIILLSWFDAEFGNNREHKLRTDPQLFTTNETVTLTDNTVIGKNSLGYTWNHYNNSKFPYQIRIAPDSFPCVVFYLLEGSDKKIFLGLYVFMDDKKSDYIYGERSIYKFAADPFCLTEDYRKQDTSTNKVWDNKDVLRIEVLTINTVLSSFNVNTRTTDIEQKVISKSSTDSQDSGIEKFRWEEDFELIYPDEDNIEEEAGNTKFSENSKFRTKTKPFVDWLKWLSDTKYNWDKTVSGGNDKTHWEWSAGQYSSALLCFLATAPSHLDLYKLAAYYIFFLRLGLVDSVERNAQLKTYDGQHWHYEPWDMDIALGNKNTGGIAFDPPIDRNSKFIDTNSGSEGLSYAFGGRGADKNTGEIITSNWLWDALEGWGWWKGSVVRETAEALSKAGLNYTTLINFFDKEYADKWCELIYNENGYFKYIQLRAGDNSWLNWLLGSRATHRHWWLNASMNYYDSFWKVGDFKEHRIYIAADYTGNQNTHDLILVRPRASTFFELSQNDEKDIEPVDSLGNVTDGSASRENPALFDLVGLSFAYKVPLYLYGATYIEELDLSCLADGLDGLELGGSYSEVEGAPIKILNIGTKLIPGIDENHYTGKFNTFDVNIRSGTSSEDVDIYQLGYDSLLSIHTLNMRGQKNTNFNLATLFRDYDRNQLRNFYAMGSTFNSFYSSKTGNLYENLELPGINKNMDGSIYSSFTYLDLNNSSWNNLTFWNGTVNNLSVSLERCNINGDYSLGIPSSLRQVVFTGTTCTHEKSKEFILNWIDCIIALEGNVNAIKSKQLELRNIKWRGLTYSDIEHLALFNNGDNKDGKNFSGYIVLLGNELTVELLTQLKVWFGDSVFTPNSKGLVIDLESDYVRVNVGGDDIELRTVDDGEGNISNEIYLTEGGSATLNATKFLLAEQAGTYNWSVRLPDTSIGGAVYKSCNIGVGADGVTRLYTRQSTEGDYDVDVVCISAEGTGTAPLNSTVRIHIITATYPDDWKFNYTEVENSSNIRLAANNMNFYAAGVTTEIYVEPIGEFTAGITDVKFTLTKLDSGEILIDNLSYNEFKGNDPTPVDLPNELYLVYTKLSLERYGITLAAKGIDYGDNIYYYTLTATIVYKSNSTASIFTGIMVSDDSVVLVDVNRLGLIDAISNAYINITQTYPNENKYYKSELLTISGELDFSINLSTQTTTSFLTYKNDSVFKYLPRVTSLILDGCSLLTTTDTNISEEDKRVLRLDKMPIATNLSMLDCSSLSGQLDLSDSKLKTIKISGTNQLTKINVPSTLTSISLIDNTTDSPNLIGLAYNSGLFESSLILKITINESLEKRDLSFYENLSLFLSKLSNVNKSNNNISGYLYVLYATFSQYLILRKYLKNVKIDALWWDDPFAHSIILLRSGLTSVDGPVLAALRFTKHSSISNSSYLNSNLCLSYNSYTRIIFLNKVSLWSINEYSLYGIYGTNNSKLYAPALQNIYGYRKTTSGFNYKESYYNSFYDSYGNSGSSIHYTLNLLFVYCKNLRMAYVGSSQSVFILDQTTIPDFKTGDSNNNWTSIKGTDSSLQYKQLYLTLYVKDDLVDLYKNNYYPYAKIYSISSTFNNIVDTYEQWKLLSEDDRGKTLIGEFMTTYD